MNPRAVRRAARRQAADDDGDHRGRDRRTGLPQHQGRRRCPGRARARDRRRRPEPTAAATRCTGQRDQPGVHLRQPDRPAAPRAHPLGGARRRARPGPARGRRRRHPRVLHQRPRRADGPVRRSPCMAAAHGRADPRGRLPRRVRQRPRAADRRRRPGHHRRCRRTSSCVAFREAGYELQLKEQQAAARALRHPLRRLVLRADAARAGGVEQRSRSCASRATSTRPTARVAAHHRLRRRQGPRAGQGRRRADLLRLRRRLLRRQARPRLRRLHLPARRRPPRLRRTG